MRSQSSLVDWLALGLAFSGLGWGLIAARNHRFPPSGAGASTPATVAKPEPASAETHADVRRREILEEDVTQPGDPELVDEYREINEQHFGKKLPDIPVIWEPRLKDIGALTADNFTLKGLTDGHVILINADLKADKRELRGVLCHEMVHTYLFSTGDTVTKHGPPFQAILGRLLDERAFEGLSGSEAEKTALRSWLNHEADRLYREDAELGGLLENLNREHVAQEEEVRQINARIADANRHQSGGPSQEEIRAVQAKSDLLNQRASDFNAQAARNRDARDEFNRRALRYNLMMSYPDGLDEESVVKQQEAAR